MAFNASGSSCAGTPPSEKVAAAPRRRSAYHEGRSTEITSQPSPGKRPRVESSQYGPGGSGEVIFQNQFDSYESSIQPPELLDSRSRSTLLQDAAAYNPGLFREQRCLPEPMLIELEQQSANPPDTIHIEHLTRPQLQEQEQPINPLAVEFVENLYEVFTNEARIACVEAYIAKAQRAGCGLIGLSLSADPETTLDIKPQECLSLLPAHLVGEFLLLAKEGIKQLLWILLEATIKGIDTIVFTTSFGLVSLVGTFWDLAYSQVGGILGVVRSAVTLLILLALFFWVYM